MSHMSLLYKNKIITVYTSFWANSKEHCEKFEDAKAVIISRNLKANEQRNVKRNGQEDKQ